MALIARYEATTQLHKPKGASRYKPARPEHHPEVVGKREADFRKLGMSYDNYYVHPVLHGTPGGNAPHPRGPPGASRGIPNPGLPRWGFERCPSLLPPVLQRDCGRLGRSVAGLPPSSLNDPPASTCRTDREDSTTRSTARTPSGRGAPAQPMSRVLSDPGLGRTWNGSVAPKYSGLQGVIGMQWDNANQAAGDAYRGGDGRYLGM